MIVRTVPVLLSLLLVLVPRSDARAQDTATRLEQARQRLRDARARSEAMAARRRPISARNTGDWSEEPFNVGMEFRIMGKRNRPDLGGAILRCWKRPEIGADGFEVGLNALVQNPDKDEREPIKIHARRRCKLEGRRIVLVGEDTRLSTFAEKYKSKVLNTLALAYVIKYRAPEGVAGPFPVHQLVLSPAVVPAGGAGVSSLDCFEPGQQVVHPIAQDVAHRLPGELHADGHIPLVVHVEHGDPGQAVGDTARDVVVEAGQECLGVPEVGVFPLQGN